MTITSGSKGSVGNQPEYDRKKDRREPQIGVRCALNSGLMLRTINNLLSLDIHKSKNVKQNSWKMTLYAF